MLCSRNYCPCEKSNSTKVPRATQCLVAPEITQQNSTPFLLLKSTVLLLECPKHTLLKSCALQLLTRSGTHPCIVHSVGCSETRKKHVFRQHPLSGLAHLCSVSSEISSIRCLFPLLQGVLARDTLHSFAISLTSSSSARLMPPL